MWHCTNTYLYVKIQAGIYLLFVQCKARHIGGCKNVSCTNGISTKMIIHHHVIHVKNKFHTYIRIQAQLLNHVRDENSCLIQLHASAIRYLVAHTSNTQFHKKLRVIYATKIEIELYNP